ncbi:MAG: hypothetical protein KGJ23_02770 [Euryarchaeota archaeon]|nr:hypothetical protein [Euryarchaeota archaeon]MDE1835521.1 hypothetical protein [Euryarchaeota archaeon]MDE1879612.1 hypothetical protein [Euryarchaeota archaeon]MDE2043857.1 hypothetical protein [Thermoplasmata archaeon]
MRTRAAHGSPRAWGGPPAGFLVGLPVLVLLGALWLVVPPGSSSPAHATAAFPAEALQDEASSVGGHGRVAISAATNATGNLTASLNRAVLLVGIAASGIITLVWSRVAISWFSHDPTKKVQAKERARDALVGSMVLLAAVSGLAWGLAHWVLTGT